MSEMVDLLSTSSKIICSEFKSHKASPPTAQVRVKNKYPSLTFDWKKIYSLAFNVSLDTKLGAFQYKLLNRNIFTNDKLFAFKIVDFPVRTFCENEDESLEHLFYFCNVTTLFWKEVLPYLGLHFIIIKN